MRIHRFVVGRMYVQRVQETGLALPLNLREVT